MNRKHILPGRSIRGSVRRAGTVTLEMALCLLLLFNICFGVVEFGYYFFVKNTLESAAREGCRAAIPPGATEANVTAAVLAQLKAANLLPSSANSVSPYTVTTTPSDISTTGLGNNVSCTVSGTWGTVGSGWRPLSILSSSKTVSGSTTMRKEG